MPYVGSASAISACARSASAAAGVSEIDSFLIPATHHGLLLDQIVGNGEQAGLGIEDLPFRGPQQSQVHLLGQVGGIASNGEPPPEESL